MLKALALAAGLYYLRKRKRAAAAAAPSVELDDALHNFALLTGISPRSPWLSSAAGHARTLAKQVVPLFRQGVAPDAALSELQQTFDFATGCFMYEQLRVEDVRTWHRNYLLNKENFK